MIQPQQEQQAKFNHHLAQFWSSKGISLSAVLPSFDNTPVDLFQLYKTVCKRGGGRAVSNKQNWKSIADEMAMTGPDPTGFFKRTYFRFLFPYEQKYYFGREPDNDAPELIPDRKRRFIKQDEPIKEPLKTTSTIQTKSIYAAQRDSMQQAEADIGSSSLFNEICRQYEKIEKAQNLHYLKKDKLEPTASDIKRIIFGLDSKIKSQVMFALNMLLLYSTNSTHVSLVYDQFGNIVDSLGTYICTIYPPKFPSHWQQLRTITLIIRNFTLNTPYLQLILKTPLFQTLIRMYNNAFDKECSRNIVDIMTGLVRVGWDCNEIVRQIQEGLDNDNTEEIEIGVDLIRGLVDQRDQNIGAVVVANIDTFVKLFVSSTSEIRETVLEIFAYISDINTNSRLALAKHPFLIQRLIEILTMGVQQYDKLTQLSALTLSNIAAAPGSREYVKMFERELVMIASSDERIGNIAAGILAQIDNY